jgi:hypothetical protein
MVVNLHVDGGPDVDDLFERAGALDAEGLREPYDAFWGARCAVVRCPRPLVLGLSSPIDPAHRSAPPAVADFAEW